MIIQNNRVDWNCVYVAGVPDFHSFPASSYSTRSVWLKGPGPPLCFKMRQTQKLGYGN